MKSATRSRRSLAFISALVLWMWFAGDLAAGQDSVIPGGSAFPTQTRTPDAGVFVGAGSVPNEAASDGLPAPREASEGGGESGTNFFAAESTGGGGGAENSTDSQQSDSTALGGASLTESAGEAITEAEILTLEEPRTGTVGEEAVDLISIQLPANGSDFPNILLTLSTTNERGDADILCLPVGQFNPAQPPQRGASIWVSDHSQGKDYVFISRNQDLYQAAKRPLNDAKLGKIPGISITCGVIGYSPGGTDYHLELDIDYSNRALVPSEQAVMQHIFDKCCLGGPALCTDWKNFKDDAGQVSMDFCHSLGSICDKDGHLVRLDLRKLNFGCEFPMDEITQLKKLEKLQLEANRMKGDVSEILQAFASNLQLQHLDLSENMLTGALEEGALCDLTHTGKLEFLNLELNAIEGTLPACLFDERSTLKELIMDRNELDGELPPIPAASKLQVLRIAGAGLKGPLHSSLGKLQALVVLDLSMNHFEGVIPQDLGKSGSLRSIRLQDNNLGGPIPGALANASGLRYLHLENNQLDSFGPEWYTSDATGSAIILIDTSRNRIKGGFPTALLSAPNLVALNLRENELSGPLPNQPQMLINTVQFVVSGNLFEGDIPDAFSGIGFFNEEVVFEGPKQARRLFPIFDVSSNDLTGPLPAFFNNESIPNVSQGGVYLGGNDFELECPIPSELVHIEDLECFDEEMSSNSEAAATVSKGEAVQDVEILSEKEQGTVSLTQAEDTQQVSKDDEQRKKHSRRHHHHNKEKKAAGGTSGIIVIVVACIAAVVFVAVLVAMVLRRKKIKRRKQIDQLVGRDVELNNHNAPPPTSSGPV